jgi:serpin B
MLLSPSNSFRHSASAAWVWAVLALGFLAAACDSAQVDTPEIRSLTSDERAVVEASNAFGIRLYASLAAATPGENLFLSPTSVSMALGMTVNGAAGQTRQELVDALGNASMTVDALNAASASLLDYLQGLDPLVQTELANAIWHEATFIPQPAFIQANATYYDAAVEALDFRAPAAVDVINGWVDEKTHGKIQRIVDGIPQDAVMYLVNAIYFKGSWTYAFDPEQTQDRGFTNVDGSLATVPTMAMKATVPYQKQDAYAAIDLPYGGGPFRMTIVVPEDPSALPALIAGLDAEAWRDLVDGFDDREVNVFLPRFTVEYSETLNDALKALGIRDVFDEHRADLSGIQSDADLFVSRVLHKAFVDVNEEGTEAAAVTAVEVGVRSAGPDDEEQIFFRADRPFLYAIREMHSGAILFIGTQNRM